MKKINCKIQYAIIVFLFTITPNLFANNNINSFPTSTFIENKGQIADKEGNLRSEILFTSNISGANIYFKNNSVEYQFYKFEKKQNP